MIRYKRKGILTIAIVVGVLITAAVPVKVSAVELISVEENLLKEDGEVENIFIDIQPGAWYIPAVQYAYDTKLMTGKTPIIFDPNGSLTRAEFATVLYSQASKPETAYTATFTDVSDGIWYTSPVIWAYNNKIVSGYGDGIFSPNDNVTREQLALMMYKFAELKGIDTSISEINLDAFSDKNQISSWSKEAMHWAISHGVISGKGLKEDGLKYLDPQGNATRAECAAMMKKMLTMGYWEPFAENVTVTIPVYDRGVVGVPAIGENYWETWIQENFGDKYNITMEFVPITRSDVLTSYSLLAAAGNLPTILMEYDYPKQAQWVADGYLTTYDIDEFASIAPTYYNRMVELNQLGYTEMKGECYFVLAERPYYNTNYTMITFYREDWLKQIGYSEYPDTWAEEKEMLLKLQSEGICEHPLGGRQIKGAGEDQNYAYRSFPLDEENWAGYGDYAIPALGDAANKALLKRVNEQYNLGFINPEYDLIDFNAEEDNFINGKSVQFRGRISENMEWLTDFYEQNPDGDLAVKIAKNVSDTEGGTVPAFSAKNPFGMMISFSSQATEDEIKGAMMYLEWMTQEENLFTMQWGNEGEHYTLNDAGLPIAIADYTGNKKQGYNNSKDYWCVSTETRNAGTIVDVIEASTPKGIPEDFTQDIIDNYYAQVEIANCGYAIPDCNFAVRIESQMEYQETLLILYAEYRNKLTKCDPAEFDKLYEDYAKLYADAGYQAIVDERLEAYNAGNSTRLPK